MRWAQSLRGGAPLLALASCVGCPAEEPPSGSDGSPSEADTGSTCDPDAN